MSRKDLAQKTYESLVERYGCEECVSRGDNGCGTAFFPGYEFYFDDDGTPVQWEQYEWFSCGMAEARENRKKMRYGVKSFELAIEVALGKAPSNSARESAYGDIVRSAAAVAVAALERREDA